MTYQFTYRNIPQALYLSLNQDPFYFTLEHSISTNPAVSQEAMLRYFDYSMTEGQKYGALYMPEGEGVGASIWSKPTNDVLAQQISAEKKRFIRQHLGETGLSKYRAIVEFMAARAKDIVATDSWYLSIVGLAPRFQGQGLGATLIKPILNQADALGVSSYLETFSPGNKRFYKRLGYQEAGSFVEPVIGAEYWIMVREPFAETTTLAAACASKPGAVIIRLER